MGLGSPLKPFAVFSEEGHCYLLKLVSNRVFSISSEEMETLSFLLDHPEEELPAWIDDYGLRGDGKNYDELREKRWKTIYENRRLTCLELMVAQECNMRCEYCYGDANFGGRGLMSFETAQKAVDAFLLMSGDEPRRRGLERSISFFGGEPLLNFPLIRRVMEYVRHELGRSDVVFAITSNVSLLTDEMLSFLKEYPVGFSVSFDGRMQRRYRRFANGEDSYDVVAKNIKKVLEIAPWSKGRGTLYGEGDAREMREDLREMGFRKSYLSGASGCLPKGVVLNDKEERYWELIQTYPEVTRRYLAAIKERDVQSFLQISFDEEYMEAVGYGYHPSSIMMSCGCGRLLFAVDTTGDVYPCHRFVGTREMRLGNVDEGFLALRQGPFSDHITFHNPECEGCFLRFSCGGSCMHENYCDASAREPEPSVHVPFHSFCEYRRMAARLSIHVTQSLTEEDRRWLRTVSEQEP